MTSKITKILFHKHWAYLAIIIAIFIGKNLLIFFNAKENQLNDQERMDNLETEKFLLWTQNFFEVYPYLDAQKKLVIPADGKIEDLLISIKPTSYWKSEKNIKFKDIWQTPIYFTFKNQHLTIYSLGKNKKFDNLQNDDLKVMFKLNNL